VRTLRGVAASPGTAIGTAYVYRPDVYDVPTGEATDPDKGIAQLAAALDAVAADLDDAAASATGAARDILDAQAAIARDPALRAAAEPAIRHRAQPARAILDAGERFARELEATGNDYLAARAPDVRHLCDLAARALAGAPPRTPPHAIAPCILIADDLTPADTIGLDPTLVRGIATSGGTRTSHTSVIARGLGIPAVVGVRGLLDSVEHGATVGIDSRIGQIVIDPSTEIVEQLTASGEAERVRHERLRAASGAGPTTTADGCRIEVAANVRGVEELRAALAEGAEAVGLLRTELLYIDRDRPPTQAEQEALLRGLHELLGRDRRLLVRTFDIGADKQVPFLPARPERNPELGVRGIRLARVHPDLLDTQLRAVAGTSSLGPTAVMAPMVATLEEVRWFVSRCRDAGIPSTVELGVMVEVPAMALMAAELAPLVDFVSIGTNDLTQYLCAADRRHAGLSALHDAFNPAVLRAIDLVCRGAGDTCWVGVCGEAASDPAWALLAIGLGVSELSMQGVAIPEVRAAIRAITREHCRDAARDAVLASDADTVRAIAQRLIKEQQ